jgi:hypothetical protein
VLIRPFQRAALHEHGKLVDIARRHADMAPMNRRKLLAYLGFPAIASLLGGAYIARARGQNPYYNGPVTTNFDGLHFSDGREITKGFKEFFQWQLQGGRESWPASFPTPPHS